MSLTQCSLTQLNMNEGTRYLDKVFKSIKKNVQSLRDEGQQIQGVLNAVQKFYVSLFGRKNGFFGRKEMDSGLAKAPKIVQPEDSSSDTNAGPATSEQSKKARKGLGKGGPGLFRKETVTKRQERRRSDTEFKKRQRKPTSSASKVPITIAPKSIPKVPAPRSDGGETSTPPPPKKAKKTETRQQLDLQLSRSANEKRVSMITDMCNAAKDQPPNSKELEMFWILMDSWKRLDKNLVEALARVWNQCVAVIDNPRDPLFLEQILHLAGTSNGVEICIQHFIGTMIKKAVRKNKDGSLTATLEIMERDLKKHQYGKYLETLNKCGCEKCLDVVQFDENYKRYHDRLEVGEESEETTEPPRFADRPMHCNNSEILAHTLRSGYHGLSASVLQKHYYFANTTPPFSPPTLALATPTDVRTTTLKYLQPFMHERRLQDPLPTSWRIPTKVPNMENLITVPKDSLHFYDGDSLEIKLDDDATGELSLLETHDNHIRIRMKHHDSPEGKFSVRIYKQAEPTSMSMTTFMTRHIGIESLRATRKAIFEAQMVYIEVERDGDGELTVLLDVYGRRLMTVWLQDQEANLTNLAEKLAGEGYTLSFYTTGIHEGIDANMREAITEKRGIFNLPDEIFTYPFRPWEIRREWPMKPEFYKDYQPILNPPTQPETQWKPSGDAPVQDDSENESQNSQDGDSFFFRIIPCTMHLESLCFKAKSTIPVAGNGLFLKPHTTIPKGAHLCLYAEKATSEAEMIANGSSRNYSVEVPSQNVWFDAELETGNNLGRFANQPRVQEVLESIKQMSAHDKPQMTQSDWKNIEDEVDSHCNAEYKRVAGQLVIVAKHELAETRRCEEVFINYGGFRSYWIHAVMERPDEFPKEMADVVHWLIQSEDCNWTQEQRDDWSHV